MKLMIIQPAYLPWLGFIERMRLSDAVVLLDTVQMDWSSKTKFVNRNKIRSSQGAQWLTIPLMSKGENRFLPISHVPVDGCFWIRKHLQALSLNYSKAPYFTDYYEELSAILMSRDWHLLGEVLECTLDWFFELWELSSKVVWAHDIGITGEKSELILNICKQMGATQYVSGPFGRSYLDGDSFERCGIEIVFHDFKQPVYQQLYPDFIPNLSSLDALFLLGKNGVMELLNSDRENKGS